MTEQEYIDVKELTILRDVARILSDITPVISSVIPDWQYKEVRQIMNKWERDLSEQVKIIGN